MTISSIVRAVREFFSRKFAPNTPVQAVVEAKALPKRRYGPKTDYYTSWIRPQFASYNGDRMLIVQVPRHVDLLTAQRRITSYIGYHYGAGRFKTRSFASAHTIHVKPIA